MILNALIAVARDTALIFRGFYKGHGLILSFISRHFVR